MMDFLSQTPVMIGMGVLLILLTFALPAMVLIMVLCANRVPRRREPDNAMDEERPRPKDVDR